MTLLGRHCGPLRYFLCIGKGECTLDFELGERASALRSRLRDLIAAEVPTGYLGAFTDDPADLATAQRFCRKLAEEGLLTWSWPEEYGGSGGSVWEQTVVREEMWAHHEPRGAQYMGLNWVGPAIMAFGTDEQKSRFLPPIAAGEVIWCQGFSEPGAGSDLAALSTRADAEGDGFRITGQKIWTSYAQMAQWCVLAARVPTGPGAKKQEGITIFLLPMDRPGITVRPIQSMLGPHHLNEVFFDDVRADPGEVLGGVGAGWTVIRKALAHERVGIARYARCDRLMSAWAGDPDRLAGLPDFLRQQWVRALVAVRVSRLLAYRAVADQESGGPAEVSASAARLAVTQCDQQVAELLFQAIDDRSLEGRGLEAPLAGAIEDHWRYAQAATVASGTIEIQRMIVSRALLAGSGDSR
jgi:alkylation response protein AidB-like acyl-CoA dehydrogenase